MTVRTITPLAMPRNSQVDVMARARNAVEGKTSAEILSMLGNLDAAAHTYQPRDEVMRLFRLTASVWRTELSRIAPGTYVTLSLLK